MWSQKSNIIHPIRQNTIVKSSVKYLKKFYTFKITKNYHNKLLVYDKFFYLNQSTHFYFKFIVHNKSIFFLNKLVN